MEEKTSFDITMWNSSFMPSEIPENSRGHKKVYFFLTMYRFLRIPVNIHHDRSDRNQRAAEERGGFYRFTEDHGAEKDAEQDSGVVVDADLGCRGILGN